MNRRGFLKLFGAGVAGVALEEAIPFNRVWFFPKKIILPVPYSTYIMGANAVISRPEGGFVLEGIEQLSTIYWEKEAVEILKKQFPFERVLREKKLPRTANGPFQLFNYKLGDDEF